MTTDRAWVLLPSGRRLDLLSPAPDAWTDRDLAIGLSRTYRWGGHSRWELPLSVAQHSLTVLVLRQQMNAGRNLTPAEALRELLHDGDEGLLGFDPISPLKPHLGEGFKAVSDRLRAAIETRYRLQPWSGEDHLLHKRADQVAAASEAFHVTGWSREAIRDSLLIALDPVQDDPLPTVEGMQPWEPWPPRIAAALFLAKLHELMRADADGEHAGSLAGVVAREATLRRLADSFSRLPAERRHGCRAARPAAAWPIRISGSEPAIGRNRSRASWWTASATPTAHGTSKPISRSSQPRRNCSSDTDTTVRSMSCSRDSAPAASVMAGLHTAQGLCRRAAAELAGCIRSADGETVAALRIGRFPRPRRTGAANHARTDRAAPPLPIPPAIGGMAHRASVRRSEQRTVPWT
jgi:hypothetical protein